MSVVLSVNSSVLANISLKGQGCLLFVGNHVTAPEYLLSLAIVKTLMQRQSP